MSDAASALVVYGSPLSPFVRKVAALCTEKDVDFAIEGVNVFDPPEWFLEISPMKRIPVLRDRSIATEGVHGTIADSSAICGYIERKHPAPALYPDKPFAYGRALAVEEFADTELAASGGLGIFRPMFFAASQGKEPDTARAQATWAEKMPRILDTLEGMLDGNAFFAGDALSIADLTVACVLMQVSLVAEFDLSGRPALAAHFDAMRRRDSSAGPYTEAEKIVGGALPKKVALG